MNVVILYFLIITVALLSYWWMNREMKTYKDGGHLGHQLMHMFFTACAFVPGLILGVWIRYWTGR